MGVIYTLSNRSYKGAVALPLIAIKHLHPSLELSRYDALIFTSKNGVEAFSAIEKLAHFDIFSIGEATSTAVRRAGGKVFYEAKSAYGNAFAKELLKFKDKRFLFPRAKVILSTLVDTLKQAGIFIEDVIVYETCCQKQSIPLDNEAIIIFSSPSTIECFFKQYAWKSSYQAIVIGTKTLEYLPKGIVAHVAPQQTLSACIALAKTLKENP